MRKINWNILNIAFWIEIILSYVLPFQTVGEFQYKVGFPLTFITVYNKEIGITPLMSMQLNPLGLILNGILIYIMISICVKAYQKIK